MIAVVGSSRKGPGVRGLAFEKRRFRCRQGRSKSSSPIAASASSRPRTERSISSTGPVSTRALTSIRWPAVSGSASRSKRARKALARTASSSRNQHSFRLEPLDGYSLKESAGFIDAWHEAPSEGGKTEGHLHLAFLTDGDWIPAGVCLTQDASAVVTGTVYGEPAVA